MEIGHELKQLLMYIIEIIFILVIIYFSTKRK